MRKALYDVTDGSAREAGTIDGAWSYEPLLSDALDALSDRSSQLDGRLWLTALVPFVAGLFARTPDYPDRYVSNLGGITDALGLSTGEVSDHATNARLITYQETLAPVMCARWIVVHFPDEASLITSDRGFCLTSSSVERGYAVPLDKRTTLVVVPQVERTVLYWRDSRWVADVAHVDAVVEAVPPLRRAITAFARAAVFGATEESVNEHAEAIGSAPAVLGEMFEVLSVDWICHIYDFFRVLSVAYGQPSQGHARADRIDWDLVAHHWEGAIVTEVLFPGRTVGGVSVGADQVRVDLSFGAGVRAARRAVGDFRKGAMGLCSIEEVRRATEQGLIPPTMQRFLQ